MRIGAIGTKVLLLSPSSVSDIAWLGGISSVSYDGEQLKGCVSWDRLE